MGMTKMTTDSAAPRESRRDLPDSRHQGQTPSRGTMPNKRMPVNSSVRRGSRGGEVPGPSLLVFI